MLSLVTFLSKSRPIKHRSLEGPQVGSGDFFQKILRSFFPLGIFPGLRTSFLKPEKELWFALMAFSTVFDVFSSRRFSGG